MPRHGTGPRGRASGVLAAVLGAAAAVGLAVGGWALLRPEPVGLVTSGAAPASSTGTPAGPQPGASSTRPAPSSSPASSPATSPPDAADRATRTPPGLTAADLRAGVLSKKFPQRGTGRLAVVPGSSKAPRAGRTVRVRVEVEGGLKIDARRFADFAVATLNDRRSWAHDGYAFARTDGAAEVRLVLTSPDTSARMCLPLRTFGRLSCHAGDATVLTVYRWVDAIPEYGADRTGYRHYVVNHEVGHALGHGHEMCPGAGRRAPVMMQQTKGLNGCLPNSWPYPGAA